MEGHGEVATTNTSTGRPLNGTLLYQLHDPRTRHEFGILWNSSDENWIALPNVKVWFNEAGQEQGVNGSNIPGINGKDYSAGSLTVGYGALGPTGNNRNYFGPELGFGFNFPVDANDKILIVKTAWGGKSLAHDFRPPSSTVGKDPYCQPPDCDPTQVGHFYQVMVENVRKIIKPGIAAKLFPDLSGLTPELAGFGWFQGWNDGCSLNDTAAYETNMVHLIQDLRNEWNSPHLPISIAVSGFGGYTDDEKKRTPPDCWDGPEATKINCDCGEQDRGCRRIDIILSQFAANPTRHPELECCVVAMETRGFWRSPEFSPNPEQGYHLYHNAETHYLVGKAMAKGMMLAMSSQQQNTWKTETQ
jgi:Carbohydrate esterase, sialic acid-specific acetylesterase